MTYIGVDPAIKKPHAYSVWVDSKVVEVGKFSLMKEFFDITDEYEPDIVFIENQYLAKNFDTAKNMSFKSGMVAGLCEYFDIDIILVNTAIWINKIEIYKDIDKNLSVYMKHKEKLKRLIEFATKFYPVKDEDEASAVLIPYAMVIK